MYGRFHCVSERGGLAPANQESYSLPLLVTVSIVPSNTLDVPVLQTARLYRQRVNTVCQKLHVCAIHSVAFYQIQDI